MDPEAASGLSATLDDPKPAPAAGDALPPLWQWVYFPHWPQHSSLGNDGHPATGRFMPPLPDRRRMFAGGRVHITTGIVLGRPTEKTTTLANTAIKTGQSGKLVFVTIRSEYRQGSTVCLVDEQDYVYRSGEPPSKGFTAPVFDPTRRPLTPWSELFVGDPVRLFRFSALTANPHRIHYDRPYAQEVEGYPDIVVHGPLLALLMSDLVREHSSGVIRSVEFRLRRPVFRGERMWVTGEPGASSVSTTVRSHAEDIRAEATFTVAE